MWWKSAEGFCLRALMGHATTLRQIPDGWGHDQEAEDAMTRSQTKALEVGWLLHPMSFARVRGVTKPPGGRRRKNGKEAKELEGVAGILPNL